MNPMLQCNEKASEFVKFRCTPTELQAYQAAAKTVADGNMSGFFKQAANEKIEHQSHAQNPRRTRL